MRRYLVHISVLIAAPTGGELPEQVCGIYQFDY